jgi:inhibitor of cysteine peptidase
MKRLRALGLLLACMVMASCASSGGSGGGGGGLAPPTPEDVRLHIRAPQAGLTIPVRVGQTVAVELVGVPTAGYLWSVVERPAFLALGGQASGPTIAAQREPGYAGGNHWEVFLFTADRAGSGVLKLEQRRPWERDTPPSNTFSVTIAAN